MPKLSIITVCLNSSISIERTIRSVINQSFQNYEYLIIDGGSNDGTIAIIQKYLNKISYFKSEPDNGIYNALNKGIKASKGEYLFFLNSGDIIYNLYTLERAIDLSLNSDICYGDIIFNLNQ